ncbi:glycosyltransferase family 2 protein [Parathielavia hyrcaniae]|uniref:Glycosyltransferase family 2 protein n=1 Tax=Parathielavia hyrcaniae TaxID=113614 RepID=A0AAN6SXG1_9PEZI|nr:glycosyltransferase family 2 protein [Parathielavia hyrcaniae]
MTGIMIALDQAFTRLAGKDSYLYWFLALFAWRYLRFVVNLAAFWCYSPSPVSGRPLYTPSKDVTAVIPTVAPESADFSETLCCCADNEPAKIFIVAPGKELFAKARSIVAEFTVLYPSVEFKVLQSTVVSKREQVAVAIPHVQTDITVLLDDHVFWGPRYLESLLCPFASPSVGLVGTNKLVRRADGLNLWGRIWNMLGATYLCRHNFEIRATNTVDGGVFVISGRTCAIRTEIVQHPDFLSGYTNERFFFRKFGPLNPDDDNYITRFVVRQGWKIKIQYTDASVLETKLGVEKPLHTKFLGQCRRWVRTTWRSNLCSLLTDRTVWATQPYCVYSVYLTSLTNFAAVTDPLLVHLFVHSSAYTSRLRLALLVCWILLTKTVKVFDYFRRHPQDLVLFPVYLAFGYFHSLIKFWALLTFWDCAWSGRKLDQIKGANPGTQGKKNGENGNDYAGPEHPHVAALRAIRIRITQLQRFHIDHIRRYQQPILAELNYIKQALQVLHREHRAICDNLTVIRERLGEVADEADGAGKAECLAAEAQTAITKVIEDLQAAVAGMETRWYQSISEDDETAVATSDPNQISRGKLQLRVK